MQKMIPLMLLLLSLSSTFAQSSKKFQPLLEPIDPKRIEIVRDSFGVPHIFAPTDAEAAYGLAWATLEDDTEIPKYFLAAIKNRMGRQDGIDGAKFDFGIQMMGVREMVEEEYPQVPEDFRKVLEGSAQGFNAYLKKHPEELDMKRVLPITPQDLLVGYVLAGGLMCGLDGVLNRVANGGFAKEAPLPILDGKGSNGIAFNAPKTVSGDAFLAINAHQPIEGVLSWYEAHICSEEGWNIVGSNFHGSCALFQGSMKTWAGATRPDNWTWWMYTNWKCTPKRKSCTRWTMNGSNWKPTRQNSGYDWPKKEKKESYCR